MTVFKSLALWGGLEKQPILGGPEGQEVTQKQKLQNGTCWLHT